MHQKCASLPIRKHFLIPKNKFSTEIKGLYNRIIFILLSKFDVKQLVFDFTWLSPFQKSFNQPLV